MASSRGSNDDANEGHDAERLAACAIVVLRSLSVE
jgi:hypothetical protein